MRSIFANQSTLYHAKLKSVETREMFTIFITKAFKIFHIIHVTHLDIITFNILYLAFLYWQVNPQYMGKMVSSENITKLA